MQREWSYTGRPMESIRSCRGERRHSLRGETDVLVVKSQLDQSLLFALATLIRTATPCGLQTSNLGAVEAKGIHIGELRQQGRISLYQIKGPIIHVHCCCIIKPSAFSWQDQLWVCFLFQAVISGATMESTILKYHLYIWMFIRLSLKIQIQVGLPPVIENIFTLVFLKIHLKQMWSCHLLKKANENSKVMIFWKPSTVTLEFACFMFRIDFRKIENRWFHGAFNKWFDTALSIDEHDVSYCLNNFPWGSESPSVTKRGTRFVMRLLFMLSRAWGWRTTQK